MKKMITMAIILLYVFKLHAEKKKTLITERLQSKIIIDGILDEEIWTKLDVAKDFVMLKPSNGTIEDSSRRTEVQICYDDVAIYIGAKLYDTDYKNIKKEFSARDNMKAEADIFTFAINTFNDGINEFKFHVSAAGVQADSKTIKSTGKDNFSWNAVWDSEVKIDTEKWTVEIRIPYSALRFQNTKTQDWGINFIRDIKETDEIYSWNFIDRSKGDESQYNGNLKGITNIKPPVRLSLFPFVSSGTDFKDNNSINAGLDLKYGISESYTLDATLIPDFGQTPLDAKKLNLGPYEQIFSEQRQFFVEGMELFSKGDLFYTRRIGGKSKSRRSISTNEEVDQMPEEAKILNVFKISGRNNKGLGIGFLNAVTQENTAKITNTDDNTTKREVIDPTTNYNVISIDQQFNKNSSVSFSNTNVLRQGHFRDANASALSYDVANKSNTYKVAGDFKLSSINDIGITNGLSSNFDIVKISGNFRFKASYNLCDEKFDIRDLGQQRRDNYEDIIANVSYQKFTPHGRFNSYKISLNAEVQRLYKPSTYSYSAIDFNSTFTTKKRLIYTVITQLYPYKSFDYNETRTKGRYVVLNRQAYIRLRFVSDKGKKLFINTSLAFKRRLHTDESTINFAAKPRFRISNKVNLNYSFVARYSENQVGYVQKTASDIIFGKRNIKEIENNIKITYSYNVNHYTSFKLRNYWTTVSYQNQLLALSDDGLLYNTDQKSNKQINRNFCMWNFDFKYTWLFAPGSQLMFLYRNTINENNNNSNEGYINSMNSLLNKGISHMVSLKLTYYLDYNNLKNIFK